MLPMWICFLVLPVEYYTMQWLYGACNKIRQMLKVDDTTLFASKGKFVRICVEVDIPKPLKERYTLRGRSFKIQYEGFEYSVFQVGKIWSHQFNLSRADCIRGCLKF